MQHRENKRHKKVRTIILPETSKAFLWYVETTLCHPTRHYRDHVCSVVSDSEAQWTVAPQASLPMEFSRQEHWSGMPVHSPGDLPNPGIEPTSLASPVLAGRFFTTSTTWEVQQYLLFLRQIHVHIQNVRTVSSVRYFFHSKSNQIF